MTEIDNAVSEWETPEFVEIRMDAEIGSYQDDFDRDGTEY
jgi:coenzyme PQQ precursor peptide PqqA